MARRKPAITKEEIRQEALHYLTSGMTVREMEQVFKRSKSSIWLDITQRLKEFDYVLYTRVIIRAKAHIDEGRVKGGRNSNSNIKKNHEQEV